MLVVTNEQTVGVGTERRLAGTAQTEKERDITLGARSVRLGLVGRRVERELLESDRLEVVHDGKDALFHLAGVLCTENDHFHSLKVDFDRGRRGHARRESVGGELTSVVDDKVGLAKVGKLLGCRADQHVVLSSSSAPAKPTLEVVNHLKTHHEKCVVGSRGNDSDLDTVLGVPSGKSVKDIDIVPRVEVVDGSFTVDLKSVLAAMGISKRSVLVFSMKLSTHSILMLTGPHQMSSLLPSSYTIRLSLGERPVFLPEKLINAPLDEMTAPSFMMASS